MSHSVDTIMVTLLSEHRIIVIIHKDMIAFVR